MANLIQLKMLEDLSGFLFVDKPAGIAFASVIKAIKRKFNLVKVGHGGSLDAMASGLFIVLLGDANRYAEELMGADKEYSGKIKLGLKTNTHDIHGEVLTEKAVSSEEVAAVVAEKLKDFKGDIFQTEPRYCSVRREGSAEYAVADTGEHSQFLAHVYRFKVELPDFELKASKGVIVRTLINDFGDALGCGATLAALRRTAIGRFTQDLAIPFEKVLEMDGSDFIGAVMPVSKAMAK